MMLGTTNIKKLYFTCDTLPVSVMEESVSSTQKVGEVIGKKELSNVASSLKSDGLN
jgi:hypothetical protein